MSIQDKRAEILKLIEAVNSQREDGERTVSSARTAPPATTAPVRATRRRGATDPHSARPNRLAQRRKQLAALQERRHDIEATRSNHLLESMQRLEQRIDQIEEALLAPAHLGAALPAPAPVAEPVAETVAETAAAADMDFALGGTLREGLLCDLLQLVSSNSMTGVFAVKDGASNICLYFEEGEICHATGPDMEGENAVFALMARERGTYSFKETTDLPERRTVQSKTQFLILEALRRIDEDRAS